MSCKATFQSTTKTRQKVLQSKDDWNDYVFHRRTVKELAKENNLGERQIRRRLGRAATDQPSGYIFNNLIEDKTVPVILLIDTTYFDCFGVMVFRCYNRRRNLMWQFVGHESNDGYLDGIAELEKHGYVILAVICDGKRWLLGLISKKYPAQLCQFHMVKTVTRYITRYPILPAGKELLWITLSLKNATENEFKEKLMGWFFKWQHFLNEKTIDDYETNKSHFTHDRMRSAYAALISNIRYLFIYQKFPTYGIPNTTNSIDGTFSQVKQKVHVHRGLATNKQMAMISDLLRGEKTT
ncbi:hypothetical protein HY969_02045 [Candidatus Kaiserbacteria bacterium]|nr:hypothetical protein [Candidatus Kaiserbacteria bacterium]